MDWQPSITPVEERSESKSPGRSEASSPIVVIPAVQKTTPKPDSPIKLQDF
uniref:Uncharacterized protein n=1 Tax=Caenorhabditis tropicalis TaxID=1561998 RepID=A0A1I7SXW0_9PELO